MLFPQSSTKLPHTHPLEAQVSVGEHDEQVHVGSQFGNNGFKQLESFGTLQIPPVGLEQSQHPPTHEPQLNVFPHESV
jgi:hypothetical protein